MVERLMRLVLLAGALGCSGPQRGGAVTARSIDEVLAVHRDSLMALRGVVGTAIGLCDGQRCIEVLVADSSPETRRGVPSRLEGYPVVVEVTGVIKPR